MKGPWETNPLTGIQEQFEVTPEGGRQNFRADVTRELDLNRRDRNDGSNGYGPTREMRRIASIPSVVIMKWLAEEGVDATKQENIEWVLRKLKDPDWQYLRTVDRL